MRRPNQIQTWPAPVKGLIRNSTLVQSDPAGAEVLNNFIPTAQGARIRGGSRKYADVPAAVVQLMNYRSGSSENLFAATATAVYDITAGGAGVSALTSQTSGDWSFVQFATTGGQFLYMVNGAGRAQYYNGATWTAPTITGVSSDVLSFVWAHKRRLWFVEGGTLSAWYLPVDSIAGAATEFPLDGIFRLGGALLFGGTWSLDSGDGLDDVAIFITTEGEVALYQGTDPGTAANWQLSGVYRMGRPLGKNAWFRAGGDLAILTEDGIVPVSEALQKDRAALQVAAITFPIEDLWQEAVANRTAVFNFSVVVWPTKTILIVGVPQIGGVNTTLVANTRTGAWAPILGWDVQCCAIYNDRLFFGSSTGQIVEGDAGGNDLDLAYTAEYVPKFQEMNTPAQKFALHARALWRSEQDIRVALACFADYVVGDIPIAAPIGPSGTATWGSGVKWGAGTKWGATSTRISGSTWQAVSAAGFSLAPAMSVTVNRAESPEFEIAALSLAYETGNAF